MTKIRTKLTAAATALLLIPAPGFSASIDKGLSEGWDEFPPAFGYGKVTNHSRVLITVIAVKNNRQIIVQDEHNRQWLLTAAKEMDRDFIRSQILGLESTELESGLSYYMIVPAVGYKWFILLYRVDQLLKE
jgi:hypothetical protein